MQRRRSREVGLHLGLRAKSLERVPLSSQVPGLAMQRQRFLEQAARAHIVALARGQGASPKERIRAHGRPGVCICFQCVLQRPSTLGRVSSNLEDVLAVAMAKDPRKRFPSAMSFAQAFIAARRGKPAALSVPDNAWT